MRSIDDKECSNNATTAAAAAATTQPESPAFEFQKGATTMKRGPHHRTALGKPAPSKWDDAQKWLVNLSRGDQKNPVHKASPRNSNADDTRLIPSHVVDISQCDDVVETKNVVDCQDSMWRSSNSNSDSNSNNNNPVISFAKRAPILLRDMGTEMTPIGSQEPSRSATPVRAISPSRTPVSSGPSTPVMTTTCRNPAVVASDLIENNGAQLNAINDQGTSRGANSIVDQPKGLDCSTEMNPLEKRAAAWDEAERAKYMARYKREEVKIQAWENHQKRKAEMVNRKVEVKAERLKSRAQEKYKSKLASSRRIAEEKRANAEAKLDEKAAKTCERANYIRRTGHLPSSFSFKLPSFCWN
ncbi:hypothetical protein ABFX02_05G023900 [Erythranthe guttata]